MRSRAFLTPHSQDLALAGEKEQGYIKGYATGWRSSWLYDGRAGPVFFVPGGKLKDQQSHSLSRQAVSRGTLD
jgi:hypothetical protein